MRPAYIDSHFTHHIPAAMSGLKSLPIKELAALIVKLLEYHESKVTVNDDLVTADNFDKLIKINKENLETMIKSLTDKPSTDDVETTDNTDYTTYITKRKNYLRRIILKQEDFRKNIENSNLKINDLVVLMNAIGNIMNNNYDSRDEAQANPYAALDDQLNNQASIDKLIKQQTQTEEADLSSLTDFRNLLYTSLIKGKNVADADDLTNSGNFEKNKEMLDMIHDIWAVYDLYNYDAEKKTFTVKLYPDADTLTEDVVSNYRTGEYKGGALKKKYTLHVDEVTFAFELRRLSQFVTVDDLKRTHETVERGISEIAKDGAQLKYRLLFFKNFTMKNEVAPLATALGFKPEPDDKTVATGGAPPRRMACRNIPKGMRKSSATYTGEEPSPKGLGYSARFDAVGKRRRGRDGKMWVVVEDGQGGGQQRWARDR